MIANDSLINLNTTEIGIFLKSSKRIQIILMIL
jgi:hypothetical protein